MQTVELTILLPTLDSGRASSQSPEAVERATNRRARSSRSVDEHVSLCLATRVVQERCAAEVGVISVSAFGGGYYAIRNYVEVAGAIPLSIVSRRRVGSRLPVSSVVLATEAKYRQKVPAL